MPTHCGMTGERIATAPADSVVQARVLSGGRRTLKKHGRLSVVAHMARTRARCRRRATKILPQEAAAERREKVLALTTP